ncbi:MAG: hypothetical protein ACREFQ_09090, partial [Stellaceae bacterium]
KNVLYLRAQLERAGMTVVGDASAIVSVAMGDEALARMASRRLPGLGVVANLVEFPAVAKGNARFRFQVMARHEREHVDALVARLRLATEAAEAAHRRFKTHAPAAELAHAVGA